MPRGWQRSLRAVLAMFKCKSIVLTLWRVLHLLCSGGKFPFNLLQRPKS